MADAFPISGQIDPKAFPFLVVQLHRRGATGSLKVEGPSYHKALYFRGGRVLFGSSNDPRDQLGAILIEGAKITAEQLEDVNAKVGPGNPLAKVLSDTGFVSQRELSEAARAKVERILSDVLAYAAGSFDFEDGVLPKGAVDLKLSTERLVMSAVRRVGDRNFVLRHIDGLDAVLGPTADMVPRLGEVESEAGGLPQHLDGRRTLKEAAASSRLEEFEAAKIACGLLFLGLVERVKTVTAKAAPAVTFADVDAGNELDLGATAAQAFSPEPARVVPRVEPEPAVTAADEDEPPPFVSGGEPPFPAFASPEVSPEISFVNPPFSPPPPAPAAPEPVPPVLVEPERDVRPEPAVVPPAARPEPEPEPAELETVAMKVTPPSAPGPDVSAPLPLVMPDKQRSGRTRSMSSPAPSRPAPEPPPRPSRPSKEDMAALDDLLNSRSLEGPLSPLEKPRGGEERAMPSFARSGGRRAPDSRRGPILLALAAVLLAVAAGGWFYRNRLPARFGGHVAEATPAPTLPPAAPSTTLATVATPPPAAASTLAAPVTAPVNTPVTTLRAAVPPATTARPPVTAATPPTSSLPDAHALLRAGRYPEASRAFASATRLAGRSAAVIHLLVACSAETVQKAVDNASAPELLILPVNFKGRDCYRLCWGLYASESKATAGLRTVPEYFRNGGATPKVLPSSEVVP